MSIISVTTAQTGLVGVVPSIVYINTNSTVSQVTTSGYLNQVVNSGTVFQLPCLALVSTKASPSAPIVVNTYNVSNVGNIWSLQSTSSSSAIVLPTTANHIATYTDAAGTLSQDPTTAISQGNIQAGSSGHGGTLISYPSFFPASGNLALAATFNFSGDYSLQISNYFLIGQNTNFVLQDPGVSSCNIALIPGSMVAGNIVQAGGTGLLVDSGIPASSLTPSTIFYADLTINAADIAPGGSVYIIPAVNGQSFKIRNFMVNTSAGMTTGNRDIILSDGSGIYVQINSSLVIAPVNTLWNSTGDLLFSPGFAQNQTTVVGSGLFFEAFSGSVDYDSGSIDVTLCYERIT